MRKTFTLVFSLVVLLWGPSLYAQCNAPFFSEYIEGSSNNKAFEIYNPSSNPLDLSGYIVYRFNHGATTPNGTLTFPAGTMVMPYDVYVVANSSADAAVLMEADTTDNITFYNGDDALVLYDVAMSDTIDVIGEVGIDPGSGWAVDTGFTNNHTLVRMATVEGGTDDWTVGANQWLVFPEDTFDSLGSHLSNCAVTGFGCTTNLFFSEMIEGSSSNKALEVYNPLDVAVDLSNYSLYRFNNGSFSATDSLFFPAGTMLMPQEVYVIGNSGGIQDIIDESDTLDNFTFYNGDDAIILIDTVMGDTLDAIGVIGVDPGSGWAVGSGATNNNTLVRMPSVNEGTTNWTIGATQWIVLPTDEVDSLGFHNMTPCSAASTDPEVSLAAASISVDENVGTASFSLILANAPADTVAVDLMLAASSTAMSGMDFMWMDTTVVFPANATMPITVDVDIIDDMMTEPAEDIVIKLMNPTNGASVVGVDSQIITILESDLVVPVYDIATVTVDDNADGVNDSLGVVCELRGVVYGVDMQGAANNIQFTIIDPTGGISVTNFGNAFGYTVLEGDSVHVIGEMDDFNGLAQLDPDTIIFISSGNALVMPAVVDSLGEVTESELIRINNVFLVDPSQWPGGGSANVDISTGTDTLTMRIDSDTNIPGSAAPTGLFDLIGIGGQFDNSVPRTEGYQILPRTQMDIIPVPAPGFSFLSTSAEVAEDTGMVSFEVELANAFPDTTTVSVSLSTDGTATDGLDFSGWTDTILTFPAGSTGPFQLSFMVNDDNLVEGDETIVFELNSPTGGPVLGDSVLTIDIEDNDYTPYDIGLVTADNDGDGLPDSLGVRCELRGIVHGMDQQGGNINFVFIDSTGGIAAFQFNFDDYVVEQGDEVVVRGFIDAFRGLAQIRLEEIVEVSQGNPIFTPMVVDSLGEFTESEYIRMECMRLVDTADWDASGSFNIDITNGVDTFTMRIDSDVDARMIPRPDKPFNVTGLGWQFTFDTPAIEGHQIIPQFMTDIEILPDPSVGFDADSVTVGEADGSLDALLTMLQGNGLEIGVDIAVDAANTTATDGDDYSFTAGTLTFNACGEDSLTQTVTVVDDGVTEADEYLTLILSNPTNDASLGQATLVITITDGTTNLPGISANAIRMFPNPTQGQVELNSDLRMESITVYNLLGKQVMSLSPKADHARLSLENLPAGIYTLSVETLEGTWNSKLIRE